MESTREFENETAGREWLRQNGYTFDRMEAWGTDGDIFLYYGTTRNDRGSLRYKGYRNKWAVTIWKIEQ